MEGKWKGRGREVAREREKDPEWSSADIGTSRMKQRVRNAVSK